MLGISMQREFDIAIADRAWKEIEEDLMSDEEIDPKTKEDRLTNFNSMKASCQHRLKLLSERRVSYDEIISEVAKMTLQLSTIVFGAKEKDDRFKTEHTKIGRGVTTGAGAILGALAGHAVEDITTHARAHLLNRSAEKALEEGADLYQRGEVLRRAEDKLAEVPGSDKRLRMSKIREARASVRNMEKSADMRRMNLHKMAAELVKRPKILGPIVGAVVAAVGVYLATTEKKEGATEE